MMEMAAGCVVCGHAEHRHAALDAPVCLDCEIVRERFGDLPHLAHRFAGRTEPVNAEDQA